MNGGSSPAPTHTSATSAKDDERGSQLDAQPKLLVTNWSCRDEHGYMITEGEVENTSGEKMESIQAVAKYYTASGDFVTSDDALVEYNPLLAGQRTPFKTITKGNPSIKRCNIAFKHFWGTEIRFEDAKLRRKNDAAARNADPRLVEAQKILIRLGYETGFFDGKMGPKTKAALQSYARQQGLPFDGTLSEELLVSLRARQIADK